MHVPHDFEVQQIARIELKPGEILLVGLREQATSDEVYAWSKTLTPYFPDNKVIVHIGKVRLQGITPAGEIKQQMLFSERMERTRQRHLFVKLLTNYTNSWQSDLKDL